MNISWYVGATGNLFDLQDRELDHNFEVCDTEGVLAKGTSTVKSVHRSLEGLLWVQNRIQEIKEQKKMLPCPGVHGVAVAVGKRTWNYGGVVK